MKAAVVYESMFGNTRKVAEAIGEALSPYMDTKVRNVAASEDVDLTDLDLLVIGGPTHAWGMSRPSTRKAAAEQAADPKRSLTLEPGASGLGLREWLAALNLEGAKVAAFDTRMAMPVAFTGSAARAIAKALHRRGADFVSSRQSFLVTKRNELVAGQLELARNWGEELAETVSRTGVYVR
jgi:hypothetical protein